MDEVSTSGYAWGYIGSCIPFTVCLGLILTADMTGIGSQTATMLSFMITARMVVRHDIAAPENYRQVYYIEKTAQPVKESFLRLAHTIRDIRAMLPPLPF